MTEKKRSGVVRKALRLLLCAAAAVLFAALPAAAAEDLPFTDVPADQWYYNDVKQAVRLGLINGTSASTYSPDKNMTNAEAVKLAACMNQLAAEGSVTLRSGNPWYRSYADYCLERGIITGEYDWNKKITRAEYMELFARCLPGEQLSPVNKVPDGAIPDVPMSHPHAEAIYRLYRAGIVHGVNSKYACDPDSGIRRSEVAAILNRMMDPAARLRFSAAGTAGDPQKPASLRDVFGKKITVWADGGEVKAIIAGGSAYVNAAELEQYWPWFRWQGEGNIWRFTGEAPNPVSGGLPWISCAAPEDLKSGLGIRFQGRTEEYWVPLRWLCEKLSIKLLWDSGRDQAYATCVPQVDMNAIAGKRIPILMYHAVSDDIWGLEGLFVSPSSMRDQLEYLTKNGYDPIFFSDLSHLEDYDKPVLLTFDDGYLDNYTELFPLLKEYRVKATVFVISGALSFGHSMTPAQAREMADSGLVDIQSHTADHYELGYLSASEQEDQLARSQLTLARVTRRIPYVIAYPNGGYNQTTKVIGAKYYDFGVRKDGGTWYPDGDRFGVTRSRVDRYTGLWAFADLLS